MRGMIVSILVFGTAVGAMMPAHHRGAPAPPAPVHEVNTSYGTRAVVLDRAENGHFYADAEVNDHPVRFIVDTGATDVALTKADAQSIGLSFSPSDFTVVARGASGDVRGEIVELNCVRIGSKQVYGVKAMIVDEGLDVSLLGQSFLERVASVNIAGDQMTID